MKENLIGISSYTYPYACKGFPTDSVITAEDLIDRAAELGAGCVQYGDNMPLELLDEEELIRLGEKAKQKGIILEAGMRHASEDRLRLYIHITKQIGARLLRIIIDDREGAFEPSPEETVRIIRSILPLLEGNDIVLGIENHDRFTVEEYAGIIEATGSPRVGMVVDTTNSLSTEEPCERVLEKLGPYCVCLHVKDYRITRIPGGLGLMITGACLGEGRMHVKESIGKAKKLAPGSFNIILESWMQPCSTAEETLCQEACWAEKGIRLLKQMI